MSNFRSQRIVLQPVGIQPAGVFENQGVSRIHCVAFQLWLLRSAFWTLFPERKRPENRDSYLEILTIEKHDLFGCEGCEKNYSPDKETCENVSLANSDRLWIRCRAIESKKYLIF